MSQSLIPILLCALCSGLIPVLHALSAAHIDNRIGAILVSGIGALIGLVIFAPTFYDGIGQVSWKGMGLVSLLGIVVLLVDYFALIAYQSSLPVSIGGPIVIGVSIVVATVAGMFLGEGLTPMKAGGIFLVVSGAMMLASLPPKQLEKEVSEVSLVTTDTSE